MALQTFWIAINDAAFTPLYLSVENNITSSAMSWSSLSPTYRTNIQYDGETWSVWEVCSNNTYYQPVSMSTYKAWLHNENSSINRATYDAYTPQSISSTVDVYVLFDKNENAAAMYPDIGVTSTNTMLFFKFNQTYVPGSSATNSWSQSGDTYSITVNQNNAWISTSKSVTANHNYSITIHVNSESGYDGVIVTSATNSSSRTIANATACSGYIKHASGSSTTVTTTYTPTSNGYIYLYYKTDTSTIDPDPEAADVTIVDNGIPAPEWVWSGNTCSISVADTSQWIGTTYSCSLNHSYSISVNVNAESGYDGVIISSSPLSSTAISNASSASGYITHASGDPASSTATFTAPSNSSKIYIYFISDISNITPNPETASVTITDMGMIIDVNVTLNKNSGSGGTSSVTITNGTVASNYPDITLPSRSGFTFLGYYDSQTGGTQYYTASGDGARIFDKTLDCTFYAHWQVNITDYYYSSASVYCSSSAGAATSSQGTRTVQIASASPSAGGGSVTTTIYSIDGSTSSSSLSGWSLSSDKKTLTIPSGKYAGSYTVRIKMEVSGNAPSYEGNTIYADVTVQLLAVIASSYSNPTVSHDTPITLDYAGETYTMDPSFSQTVYWTNDTSSTITSGASYSYSVVTSCTGFSLSSNKVTVSANDGETVRGILL